MKTAMEELIDEMDLIKNELWESNRRNETFLITHIIEKAVNKLEKEKEQIIDAYRHGIDNNYIEIENYYNQTYNQNK